MNDRYLLYIDILGFSNLVTDNYTKVSTLFERINDLNVHRHNVFQTIVFSDTILIFNRDKALSNHGHEYLVMLACEFVQDLIFRSIDLEIPFRAILTYDEFHYKRLENIEAYYGAALLKAYFKEKQINAQGLFIDKKILKYNNIYKTLSFDKDFDFVFLTQNLDRLLFYGGELPIDASFIEESVEFTGIDVELKMLKILKQNIKTQQDSRIRGKYLQTYELYRQRYGKLINKFEESDFDYRVISPDADWTEINDKRNVL